MSSWGRRLQRIFKAQNLVRFPEVGLDFDLLDVVVENQ